MQTLDDLATLLEAAGVYTRAVTLFFNRTPTTPANCMVLTKYGGLEPDYVLGKKTVHVQAARVQVLSRALTTAVAQGKAHDAYRALVAGNTTINGRRYIRITPLQAPGYLKHDDNDRVIFVFNVQVEAEL